MSTFLVILSGIYEQNYRGITLVLFSYIDYVELHVLSTFITKAYPYQILFPWKLRTNQGRTVSCSERKPLLCQV
jgi:hypothetical protein